jgi:hypothetical protein
VSLLASAGCYSVVTSMGKKSAILAASLAAVGVCCGCGTPGAPLPPSLELARPVRDLRAVRKANKVTLTWTAPTQTTDQQNIRHVGVTQICRSLGQLQQCGTPVGTVKLTREHGKSESKIQMYVDSLPENTVAADVNYVYGVAVLNSYGRSAGLSNLVRVPAIPTLDAPTGVQAQVTADGIRLTWEPTKNLPQLAGVRFLYRIYRRDEGGGAENMAGEVPAMGDSNTFLDKTFDWEKVYDYRLIPVSVVERQNGTEQVEGDDAAVSKVFAHDVFPPATPAGLEAAYTATGNPPYIDLVWAPDVDADLAGYNVYRRDEGGPDVKINNELVKASSYKDASVSKGSKYYYSVSAVDVRGNESARSEEANESVPRSDQQ